MGTTTFLLVRPFFVKPLTEDNLEVLQQHGCSVKVYPSARLPFGHMVEFPHGTHMHMINLIHSRLLFPDGYEAMLVWT